ncbi:alpha/beta fold hydrolase [Thermoleophilia bacterium SCSIO 60948]|nr:alpha/beta fold hydrolase [Thermoleophilia bacterium SCSIO 60948]
MQGSVGAVWVRPARLVVAIAVAVALLLTLAGSADARSIRVASPGPGPDEFDGVDVYQYGPKKPRKVLVLMPGTSGGAGNFALVAKDLVRRVDGLAVWALDRRSQPLEDTSRFEQALAGEITPDAAFDYYLGWITNGGEPTDHYRFFDTDDAPYAVDWGMQTALDDARAVVRKAKAAGPKRPKVYLGGHSLGASLAAAYAAWDFDGRAGFEDLAGIVMIDGGLLGSFDAYDLEQAQEQMATLEDDPFLDLLGIGIPESAGLFAEAGAIFARLDPDGAATTLQEFPLLPASFKPDVPVTSRALLGYVFDRDTSPQDLRLLHVNAGGLADQGDPRDWVEGGVTTSAALAKTFGREPANGVEWFFPRRLTIDTNGANQMRQNEVAEYLGLRLEHTNEIDIPIYAFQTDLTNGGVLMGAERLVRRARTTSKQSLLVDGDPRFSHLDPLTATPSKNLFAKTVASFLRR